MAAARRWCRFEVLEVALHDVDEESDGYFAVGGFQLDEVCELLVRSGSWLGADEGARALADWETD